MKNTLKRWPTALAVGFILFSFSGKAQDDEVLAILNQQVAAFNSGNVEVLVANVTDDFRWYSIAQDSLIVETKGKAQFEFMMNKYYEKGILTTSTIDSYVVDGGRVTFKEVVSYQNREGEMQTASAMGTYQIHDGKIHRAWYFVD